LVDFDSYLAHSKSYNDHQKEFFVYCDNAYSNNQINEEVKFAPYRIIGFNIKTVFDTLFSQTSIILEIINKLKPQKVYLVSTYSKQTNIQVNYFEVNRGNYCESLFNEILEYLSNINNYDYELLTIPKTISYTINSFKGELKDRIRGNRYFNLYRQFGFKNSLNNLDVHTFETIANSKNLFMNQGWGLNKLINYSFVSNSETILLVNNYIFIYKGSRISQYFPVVIDDTIQPVMSFDAIEKHVTYFDNFVKQSLGISLYTLIYNRISSFNKDIFPIIFYGSKTIDKLLKRLKVEKVIGNMKSSISFNFSSRISLHILPYLATNDSNYDFLYFTHGYDPYVVDRTFLELPCNFYFTLNKEYKNYFENSFKNQSVYDIPKVEVINL